MELNEKDNPNFINKGVVAINYKRNRINNIKNLLGRKEETKTFMNAGNQIASPKYKYSSPINLNKSRSSGNYFNNSSLYLNSSNMSNSSNFNPSFFNKINTSKNDESGSYHYISYNEIKRGLVDFSDIKTAKNSPYIGDFFKEEKVGLKSSYYAPVPKKRKNNPFNMFYNEKEKEIFQKYRKKYLDQFNPKKISLNDMIKKMKILSEKNLEKFKKRESKRQRQIQVGLDARLDKSLEKITDQVKYYFTMMDNCNLFVHRVRKVFFSYSFKVFTKIYYDEVNKYF